MQAEVPPNLQTCLARVTHHHDLAGEYDWIVMDCNKTGAPIPVVVKPEWPNTHWLGTWVAVAAQWTLEHRRTEIAAASGPSGTDDITNVLCNLPTSKLVTEDLETAKWCTCQLRGAPPLLPPLANALGGQHQAPR